MMSGKSKSSSFLIIGLSLLQLILCAYGRSISVLHFRDFIEFQVGLNTACANVTGGHALIEEISSSFGECTQPFRKVKGDPNDGKIDKFCKHRDIYFNCWDNMKLEISKKCGKDNEKMMPALYHTTLIAYCDNESTANRQDDREDAMTPQKRINKKCPSLTGKHWLETCKDLLADFTSPNLCLRHQAIDRCLGLYFCDNYLNSAWNRQKYMDERSILQCRI